MIHSFQGANRFLSNFWPCQITYEGITYPSTEAAYQAAKTLDQAERKKMSKMRPGDSKKYGRQLELRADWESVKLQVMEDVLRLKFFPGTKLSELLLLTHPHELREGNTWGDTFWGICRGKGENHLGKLLMKRREELRKWQDACKS